MATFDAHIRIRETGAKVVQRRINAIGEAASRATRGIYLFERAMWVLGGAGILRGIKNMVDTLTQMENRLQLTSQSARHAERNQDALYEAAQRSRTSFETLGEIYNRVALSSRNLGTTWKDNVKVAELLSKASILSGASTREANAALIQLGQGIASNRLSGDELRSVLEQLPYVADLIARHMGVTRGELRAVAKEGKVTAKIVMDAILAAEKEVEDGFKKTTATIGQSLSILGNKIMKIVDDFDDFTGASSKFATVIAGLTSLLDEFAYLISLVAIGLAFKGLQIAITYLLQFGVQLTRLGKGLAAYKGMQIATTKAQLANNKATIAQIRMGKAKIASVRALTSANIALLHSEIGVQGTALSRITKANQTRAATGALTAGFIAQEARQRSEYLRLTNRLNQAEANLAKTDSLLESNITKTNDALTNKHNLMQKLGEQTGKSQTRLAKLALTFPLLAGGIGLASRAFSGFWVFLAANPITAIIAAIGAAVLAFIQLGNQIKVTRDGVIGLRDYVVAAFILLYRKALKPVIDAFAELWGSIKEALEPVKNVFIDMYDTAVRQFTTLLVMIKWTLNSIITLFWNFGDIVDTIFKNIPKIVKYIAPLMYNNFIQAIADMMTGGHTTIVEKLREWADAWGTQFFKDQVTKLENNLKPANDAFQKAFDKLKVDDPGIGDLIDYQQGVESLITDLETLFTQDHIGDAGKGILKFLADLNQAILDIAYERKKLDDTPPVVPPDTRFAEWVAQMEKKILLAQTYYRDAERVQELEKAEKDIGRDITTAEMQHAQALMDKLEIMKLAQEQQKDMLEPLQEYELALQAAAQNLRSGVFTMDQYRAKLKELYDDLEPINFLDGFAEALDDSILKAVDWGQKVAELIGNTFDGMLDKIVDRSETAHTKILQLLDDLALELAKLFGKQLLFRGLSAIGLGVGTGAATNIGDDVLEKLAFRNGPLDLLPKYASGGSIAPSGSGSADTQLMQFWKSPNERVDILTPAQQRKQAEMMRGEQTGSTNVQTKTNVAVVMSPDDVTNAFVEGDGDTVIVEAIRRNATYVNAALGRG